MKVSKIFFVFALVAVVLSITLAGTQVVHAAGSDIIITEIGAYEASGHEWVEIYNRGAAAVDMTGWKFWEGGVNHGLTQKRGNDMVVAPGEYAVITQDDENFVADYPSVLAKIFDSSWGTLNESGEEIGIKDAGGIFVEQFTYILAPNFSLERKDTASDDYTAANWVEHANGNTAGQANSERGTGNNDQGTINNQQLAIFINEIVSNPNDGENEWIELVNEGAAAVDLNGWTIEDGLGVIATLGNTLATSVFFVADLTASKLNNSGDIIKLKDASGAVVHSVAYGDWDDGNVADNAAASAKGESLARSVSGFAITSTPTKSAANSFSAPSGNTGNQSSNQNQGSSSGGAPQGGARFVAGTIVINELVSDPADGAVEFVELYNRAGSAIDLSKWWLEDGSEKRTTLTGAIAANGFTVLTPVVGNLNNSGDTIILYSPDNTEIDRVSYGNWNDGTPWNNAPRPDDPMSLARVNDGGDADNDAVDFVLTSVVTKGGPNVIVGERGNEKREMGRVANPAIIINELLPNPLGSDSENEFVELKNISVASVDVGGWSVVDQSGKKFVLKEGTIAPGGFMVLKRSQTAISLDNAGESITVFGSDGVVVDKIGYNDRALEDHAYARGSKGDWSWTSKSTPGAENSVLPKTTAPVAVIDALSEAAVGETVRLDASDSTDPEGDALTFAWEFGDGTRGNGREMGHEYMKSGLYMIVLTVEDKTGNVGTARANVTVRRKQSFVGGSVPADGDVEDVHISEFLPDPEGSDETEFVEFSNASGVPVDLSSYFLDDEDGGSAKFAIPAGTVIAPGQYIVFPKKQTKLALNNTGDRVRLMSPSGAVIEEIVYPAAVEGASYARGKDNEWRWTETVTAGSANIMKTFQPKADPPRAEKHAGTKTVVATTLQKIREFDVGDRVKVSGVVAVLPGVLGAQYFYIVDEAGAGVQVYMNKKDWPAFALGDRVDISGEVSVAYGEKRIKVMSKSDIVKKETGSEPAPVTRTIAEIAEADVGGLVEVKGEITEKKSTYAFVDDGTEEIKVYFKGSSNVSPQALALGQTVKLRGIVASRNGELQLLPRRQSDLEKVFAGGSSAGIAETEMNSAGGDKEVAETYLTATAGGLTSILIGLLARARGLAALQILKKGGVLAIGLIRRKQG